MRQNTAGAQGPWEQWILEETSPARTRERPEALAGLRVLDICQANIGGLFCSSILAEFGAEVIRIEPPGGDPARQFSPFGIYREGTGIPYLVEARNKHHITLDLEKEQGRKVFHRLARQTDVIVESFPAGKADALGIGYRQLAPTNPRLIYAAISTYGQFGPKARSRKPDYDVCNQALSGIVYTTGEAEDPVNPHPAQVPTRVGPWLAWYVAGGWAAYAVLLAAYHRRRTGEGQLIDVSPAEGLMRFVNYNLVWYHVWKGLMERVGMLDHAVGPYCFARCRDSYVFIAGLSDANFKAICTVMGRDDLKEDPRFATGLARFRLENNMLFQREFEQWAQHYTAEELLAKAQSYRGPGTVVVGRGTKPREVFEQDHWWVRGIFERIEDPKYGEIVLQTTPWKLTRTPPRLKWVCRAVGQDNDLIYARYLGMGPSALGSLRSEGVV